MKRTFHLIIINLITIFCSCYTKKYPPPPSEPQCKEEKKFSADRLMTTFPFKDTKTIQLVEFDFIFNDTNYTVGIPLINNQINYK